MHLSHKLQRLWWTPATTFPAGRRSRDNILSALWAAASAVATVSAIFRGEWTKPQAKIPSFSESRGLHLLSASWKNPSGSIAAPKVSASSLDRFGMTPVASTRRSASICIWLSIMGSRTLTRTFFWSVSTRGFSLTRYWIKITLDLRAWV